MMKQSIFCALILSATLHLYAPYQTISSEGSYLYGEDVTYSPGSSNDSIVRISANNVTFDLGGYIFTQGNTVAGLNGIVVDPNLTNITIKNGYIQNITGTGIGIGQGCTRITIDNLITYSCDNRGINVSGTNDAPIQQSIIKNSALLNCCRGATGDNVLTLSHCSHLQVNGCILNGNGINQHTLDVAKLVTCTHCEILNLEVTDNIASSTIHAFNLIDTYETFLKNCVTNNIRSSQASAYGIEIDGKFNFISNNIIQNTYSSATTSITVASVSLKPTASSNQILDNIISNSTALSSTSSKAHVYGIQMQYTTTPLSTSGQPFFATGVTQNACAWSPDGQYLAIGGTGGLLRILEFVHGRFLLAASFDHGATINGLAWSPDGQYIALSGNRSGVNIRVFSFSGSGLTDAGTFNLGGGSIAFGIDWSTDGKFIAFGCDSSPQMRVLEHNQTSLSAEIATFAHGATVNSVSWSNDTRYLAMGGISSGSVTTRIFDFSFTSTASTTLTSLANFNHGATVNAVSFSSEIRFLAQGGASSGGVTLRALSFNGSSLTAASSTNISTGATVNAVSWTADGKYLSSGQSTGGGAEVRTFTFDETSLTQDQTYTQGANVNSIHWSPLGTTLFFAGATGATEVRLLSALVFPKQCIIQGNNISLILGGPVPFGSSEGHGIVASAANNLIIKNSVFDCDNNYYFSANLFVPHQSNVRNREPSTIANLSFKSLGR